MLVVVVVVVVVVVMAVVIGSALAVMTVGFVGMGGYALKRGGAHNRARVRGGDQQHKPRGVVSCSSSSNIGSRSSSSSSTTQPQGWGVQPTAAG